MGLTTITAETHAGFGRLLTPQGAPTSWPELLALNERYWQMRAEREAAPERTCGACVGGEHSRCSGFMARLPGLRSRGARIPCPCDCGL